MKRLVLAALAIGAMAACTKSNVQLEQPGEISFQPVARKATKAAVDGTYYPTDEAYNFNVWAWWGEYDAESNFTVKTPYIEEGTFMARNNISWGGVTPYYWPTKGSLVFAGYSPSSATGTFTYDIADKIFKVENFIQSNNIAEAKDLMWFDVTDQPYDQKRTDGKGVPVQFQHALSWLTFKFNLLSAATEQRWTITNVTLKGIENQGTFTAVKSGNCLWEIDYVNNIDDNIDDIIVCNDGNYLVKYTDEGTVLPGTDVFNQVKQVMDRAVLVIPQSCAPGTPAVDGTPAKPAAAELEITYNLKTYVGEGVLSGQTVTLPLNGTQISDNMWLPGKHYIYTITFGGNEILIAPSVTDWTDETVENIPVQ